MSKVVLKKGFKNTLIIIALVAIIAGLWWLGNSDNEKANSFMTRINKKDVITVGVNTYAGFMPFMYLNGGLEPNPESLITKEYGVQLKIVIQDDFLAGRSAFKNGDIDVIYGTTDAVPVEMSEGSDMTNARIFNISNWSRGADAIVVSKYVTTVQDLIGKIVACSEGTASHTLLLNTLETNGIGPDLVNTTSSVENDKVNIKIVGSGLDAAQVFKAGQCDAAVVFSPDDQDIVATMSGAHVLLSTKHASNIICDILLAKKEYIENNREKLSKMISALLYANSLMNKDEGVVKEAARYFATAFGTDEAFAIDGSKNIRYTTLGDEENFFGLSNSYTGIKGEEIYSKMSRTYESLHLCKATLPWRKISDPSIIEGLIDAGTVKGNQLAEAQVTFEAPAADMATKQEISNKKLTINFTNGAYMLDNNAKALIDREFVNIAKQFSGARIRVEGNTDNTGSLEVNRRISNLRAQAVVDYLVKEFGFDKNRFICIGNGPKHAIADNINGSNEAYRTTDFMLIAD